MFDFDGNGSAEVVNNDVDNLTIYDGASGAVLFSICNGTAIGHEFPLVADVDGDDHAEIVVTTAGGGSFRPCPDGSPAPTGIRVIGDQRGNWVRTRRIWNEHAYHVTNVDDDGTIPDAERASWTVGPNSFRQNVEAAGLFNAPDLTAADLRIDYSRCGETPPVVLLEARVLNQGASGAPAGVPVAFYDSDASGVTLCSPPPTTTRSLLPGESDLVRCAWSAPQTTVTSG